MKNVADATDSVSPDLTKSDIFKSSLYGLPLNFGVLTFVPPLLPLYDGDTRRSERYDEKTETLSISERRRNQRGATEPDPFEKCPHPGEPVYRLRG